MKKVVQQLRLEAGLNRVKVCGGGRADEGEGRAAAAAAAAAADGIGRPRWLGRAALLSRSCFLWGGRALGGDDPIREGQL